MSDPGTGPDYLEEAAAQARAARDVNDAMEADISLLLPWDHPLRVEGRATRLRLAEIFASLAAIDEGIVPAGQYEVGVALHPPFRDIEDGEPGP
jgi:hypothetical protein